MTRARNTPQAIDWADVRARLARTQSATDNTLELSTERIAALMAERTRRLARPPARPVRGGTLELLAFALGAERYALEATYVREVVPLLDFTPVPGAAPFVLGVTNLRGELLCIVDLRTFLGIPQRGVTDLARILVLGEERVEFGLLADQVFEITRLPRAAIVQAPDSVAGIGREYLIGVTREALIVLSGAALLRDPRLLVDHSETGA